MKTDKSSAKRAFNVILIIIFIAWILPGVAKVIAANTLEIREDDYGVSLGMVYYRQHNSSSPTGAVRLTRIKEIDVKNFTNLGSGCIKDEDTLLCHGQPTPTIDKDTFKIHKVGNLNSRYASDKSQVFCINNLRHVDLRPQDLIVLSGKYAKDSEKAAYNCEVFAPKDVTSLQYISGEYSKDKKSVYFRDKVVVGADPVTFVVETSNTRLGAYAHDRYKFFKEDKEISESEFKAE
jgi:hypothetical protein